MTSHFTGVFFAKQKSRFKGYVRVSGKTIYCGSHQQEQQAAKERDKCVVNAFTKHTL